MLCDWTETGSQTPEEVWSPAKTGRSWACTVRTSVCDCSYVSDTNKMSVEKRLRIRSKWHSVLSDWKLFVCYEGNFIQATLKPHSCETVDEDRALPLTTSPPSFVHISGEVLFTCYCIVCRLLHNHFIRMEKIDSSVVYFVPGSCDLNASRGLE